MLLWVQKLNCNLIIVLRLSSLNIVMIGKNIIHMISVSFNIAGFWLQSLNCNLFIVLSLILIIVVICKKKQNLYTFIVKFSFGWQTAKDLLKNQLAQNPTHS